VCTSETCVNYKSYKILRDEGGPWAGDPSAVPCWSCCRHVKYPDRFVAREAEGEGHG